MKNSVKKKYNLVISTSGKIVDTTWAVSEARAHSNFVFHRKVDVDCGLFDIVEAPMKASVVSFGHVRYTTNGQGASHAEEKRQLDWQFDQQPKI